MSVSPPESDRDHLEKQDALNLTKLCQIQLAFRLMYCMFQWSRGRTEILTMRFIKSWKHGWKFQFLVLSLDLQIIFQLTDRLAFFPVAGS